MRHKILTQSCFTYLQHYSRSHEKFLGRLDSYNRFLLLPYAAISWYEHWILQQENDGRSEAKFLDQEKAKSDWLFVHDPDAVYCRTFRDKKSVGPRSIMRVFWGWRP